MSKNNPTKVHAPTIKPSKTAKKKSIGTTKLKSSGWYKGAARSIGISNKKRSENSGE